MARLLGVRLLVIDASLLIVPADVRRTSAGAIGGGLADAERCLSEGAASLAQSRRYQSPSPTSPARR